MNKQIYNGLFWTFTDKVVNQLGYLFLSLFFARELGPDAIAVIGILTVFITFSETVINNGFTQAIIQRSTDLTDREASTIFIVNLIWGVAVYLLLYLLSPSIEDFFGIMDLSYYAKFLFLLILINCASVVFRSKLNIDLDYKSITLSTTAGTLIGGSFGLLLYFNGYGLISFVILLLVKASVSAIFIYFRLNWRPRLIFSVSEIRPFLRFAGDVTFASFLSAFTNNLYLILIGKFISVEKSGYYSQSNTLVNYIQQTLGSTIQGVSYAAMSIEKNNKTKFNQIFKDMTDLSLMLAIPCYIGFAFLSNEFVKLVLGDKWIEIIPLLIIMSIAKISFVLHDMTINYFNAVGKTAKVVKFELYKAICMLSSVILFFVYGMLGIYLSIALNSIFVFVMSNYYLVNERIVSTYFYVKKTLFYVTISMLMVFLLYMLKFENILISLFVFKILIGIVFYFVIMLCFNDKFTWYALRVIESKFKKI